MALLVGLVTVLTLGSLSFVSMREMSQAQRLLHEHPYAVGIALRDTRADILAMESELSSLATAPSRLRLRRFEREIAQIETRMSERFDFIRERFLGSRDLPRRALRAFAEWFPVRQQITEAVLRDDSVAAYTLAKTDGARQIGILNQQLDALIADTEQRTQAMRAANAVVWQRIVGTQALAFILALIAMGAVLRFMNRSIVGPTAEISNAAQRVRDGDLSTQIPHTEYRNEIGEIARATQAFLETAVSIRGAKFDFLTGLPTREQLSAHLQGMRTDTGQSGPDAALLHFDVDRFGEINDSFGRAAGDRMLIHVADTLRGNAGPEDFVARDGPDSFVLLAVGRESVDALMGLTEKICGEISAFEDVDGVHGSAITLTCSVGIAMCNKETSIEDLMAHGESALTEGRKTGRGATAIYTEEMDARLQRRRAMLQGLKFALAHEEIVPFFQPQIDAVTSELRGVEALVRWNHPEEGVLSPWQFFEVAHSAGLLGEITETMITKSIEQLVIWRRMGLVMPRISINFTANDLRRPDFVDRLLLRVDAAGLVPEDICVELLESAMIEDEDDPVTQTLTRLSELGFPIELDDFGTGHAAISTLHLVKLNGIKIDRSFITRLHERPEQQHLTRGILRISRALNISTLAEGVESDEERSLLIELGCEMIQGFAIAHPMSAYDTTRWLREYRPQAFAEPIRAAG